jgi:hypothetical protein
MTAPGTAAPGTTTGARALVAAFCALVAATQVLWLTFAPVTDESARALGVGTGAIANLAAVNPLVFVLLAVPAGRWLDRRLVPALVAGAVLTAAGAVVRAAGVDSYPVVLTGAISAASAAQFVGILVAALVGGPVVDAVGLARLLRAEAVAVAVVAAVFVVLVRRVAPRPVPASAAAPTGGRLVRDRLLVGLAVMLFVGVGVFNAVATWLDPVLDDLDRPGLGGPLIAGMTLAGIAGAAVLPAWAAARDRRRTVLLVAAVTSAVGFAVAAAVPAGATVGVLLGVLPLVGFVLLAGLPVALEWAELHVGADHAARATNLLLLAGNAGGVVLVLAVEVAGGRAAPTLLALALLSLPAVAAAWVLPRRAAGPTTG